MGLCLLAGFRRAQVYKIRHSGPWFLGPVVLPSHDGWFRLHGVAESRARPVLPTLQENFLEAVGWLAVDPADESRHIGRLARVAIAATGVSSPNQAFATALVTFTCGCRAWLCFSGKGLRDADHEDISEEAMHFVF